MMPGKIPVMAPHEPPLPNRGRVPKVVPRLGSRRGLVRRVRRLQVRGGGERGHGGRRARVSRHPLAVAGLRVGRKHVWRASVKVRRGRVVGRRRVVLGRHRSELGGEVMVLRLLEGVGSRQGVRGSGRRGALRNCYRRRCRRCRVRDRPGRGGAPDRGRRRRCRSLEGEGRGSLRRGPASSQAAAAYEGGVRAGVVALGRRCLGGEVLADADVHSERVLHDGSEAIAEQRLEARVRQRDVALEDLVVENVFKQLGKVVFAVLAGGDAADRRGDLVPFLLSVDRKYFQSVNKRHAQGLSGRGTPGNKTSHISNHFSTLWASAFFLLFCLSSFAHWTSSTPSLRDASRRGHDSLLFRCSASLLSASARSPPFPGLNVSLHLSH